MNEKELEDRKELEKRLEQSIVDHLVTLSSWAVDIVDSLLRHMPRTKLRGKWPVVLKLLKEWFPPSQYPNGFPDPAFAPRKSLVKRLRDEHPLLKTVDEATVDKAIAEYDRQVRNSSE
jgi:hypothetical protein